MDPTPLEVLQQLAQKECDEAAGRVGRTQAQLQQAEKKLQLLETYRADYQGRQRAIETTDALALSNLHAFVGKLQAAIERQQQEVEVACTTARTAQRDWMRARQRLKSLEVLLERRAAAARLQKNRLQQKQQDELAARLARARTSFAG